MKRSFVISLLGFFIPIVIVGGLVEWCSRALPSSYKYIAPYLEEHDETIEVLLLGSSQMKDAINVAELSMPAVNLASGNQHHDTDFAILKQMLPKLPKVHTVVLEVSYSHFELPHNGPDFWKHAFLLHYYDVNAYQRPTYLKDRLLFISNPKVMIERFKNHYITHEDPSGYNGYGFDTLNYAGKFKGLGYVTDSIETRRRFKINTQPDLHLFQQNSTYFEEMIAYLRARDIRIILFQAPMYRTYLLQRHPEILKRRDSVLSTLATLEGVSIFNLETDTLRFEVTDFWNESHLNPSGASKATRLLDAELR